MTGEKERTGKIGYLCGMKWVLSICVAAILADSAVAGPSGDTVASSPGDTLGVMFWNLENFFDYRDDSTTVAGAEFSSRGERRWTRKRFLAKCNAVAKGILWAGGYKGRLPDVIGVAEVENIFVLRSLRQSTALHKLDYRIVHFDSPDPRGIDVALLYREGRLRFIRAKPCHLYVDSAGTCTREILRTRDILLAEFERPGGEPIAFLVNHHPSKYGGAQVSDARRRVAVERLQFLADSLLAAGVEQVVAMGDFNDTPANPLYRELAPALTNLGEPLHQAGIGSIKFQGRWELIDLFFVSARLGKPPMKVLEIPFLQVRDKGYAGTKPLRTYSGPRYIGGVSDHCPIWLTLPALVETTN